MKLLGAVSGLVHPKPATGPNTDMLWVAQAQLGPKPLPPTAAVVNTLAAWEADRS